MVRLLLPFLAIFLFWLLFFSPFSKPMRIGLSLASLGVALLALWLESDKGALRSNLVAPEAITICGLEGTHSYRSNFNLAVCLINTAHDTTVRKIEITFSAMRCEQGRCTEVQSLNEIVKLQLAADEQQTVTENLAFDALRDNQANIEWRAQINEVWATR